MANYATLKAAIQAVIKQNGNNEITGAILQASLLSMVNSLGADYQFVGFATKATNPGTPDQNVAYIAIGSGVYPNFGGITATSSVGILKYNGTWSYESSTIATLGSALNRVKLSVGKNLYDESAKTTGVYFRNINGTTNASANYSISDYIPVNPGDNIHISATNDVVVAGGAYLIWYDADCNYLSGISMENTKQFTVPDGAAFMRFSIQNAVTYPQVEIGTSRTAYEAYNPIAGYYEPILTDVVRRPILDALISDKITELPGRNLYDPSSSIRGYFLNSSGNFSSNANYVITDYIKVTPGQNIHASDINNSAIGGASAYVWFYNSNVDKVSGLPTDVTDFTVPANAAYMRFSVRPTGLSEIQIEIGSSRSPYQVFNPLTGYPVVSDSQLNVALLKKVNIVVGKNLYDERLRTDGLYFNTATGTTGANSNYAISYYIPVTPGDNIHISATNDVVVGGGYLNWYDENLAHLSGVAMAKQFTVPSGAAFMRFSLQKAQTNVQVEIGTTRTVYEPYSPVAGYPLIIPDGTITMPKLSNELQTLITTNSGERFNSCRISGTIAPNEILRTTERYHILKDVLLSAKINGSITTVRVGVGSRGTSSFRDYYAYWVEIDTTNVKLYWYNNVNDVLLGTYAHGLTLTSTTVVEILTQQNGNTNSVSLRIFDDAGNIFTQSLPGWGVGSAFVQNGNSSSSLDVELSFVPRDVAKKIWLFGDSYISFVSNERWPYYLAQQELTNYFVNSQPGLSPDSALLDLQSLLTLGHIPSFIVWTLGMNGATTETQSGGQWVINPAQKSVIDSVVSICQNANIPLILATVPTVPDRQKTGFTNYVRSLGYRYIDFAAAVKCNDAGQWTAGLLSADNVHPSALGAKVLASQVYIDFPEIGIS